MCYCVWIYNEIIATVRSFATKIKRVRENNRANVNQIGPYAFSRETQPRYVLCNTPELARVHIVGRYNSCFLHQICREPVGAARAVAW